MSDDRHGEGTPRGGSRWDPLPQGEYDDGATAFVELPEGGVDALLAADSPLAAPGHGYVPPQIAVNPATTAGTDPAATGAWPVPGAPVDGAQWHDPNAGHRQHGQEHGAHHQQGHDVPEQSYGGPEAPYDPGPPYGSGATAPSQGDDRFTYNPGATGQWNFEESAAAAEGAPGHDVTGQWSIPVAGGDLPDESGEFTTSSLVEQWGGTPPATLPGGAPAPWATQATGQPWGQEPQGPQDPQDPAGREEVGPGFAHQRGHEHEPGRGQGPGQGDAASASGYAPDAGYADPASRYAGPDAGYAPEQQQQQQPAGPLPGGPEGAGHDAARQPGDPGQGLEAPGGASYAPGEPYGEAPEGFPGEPESEPEAHPESAVPQDAQDTQDPQDAQDSQGASQPAPGVGEAGVPSASPEGTTGAPEAADDPSEPADGPFPDAEDTETGTDPGADPGPETADGETASEDGTPVGEQEPAGDQDPAADQDPATAAATPSAAAPHDVPPAAPQEEHPLASYVLRVNGTDRPVGDAWIGESLLYVLRERLGLAGAKDGCSQGECGACNVQVDGRLVASCLVPAVTAAGSEVRTVEGLAEDGQPSDVQRALARCGAVQCGFCVPGMAMTVHDLLEGNPAPTELETRQALCGNLCRCSGYRGVVDAVKDVVAERAAHGAPADGDSDEPRIPHQAGPGAGGVNASAFGAPPEPPTPQPHSPEAHETPYGQDGGPA
ncbi:2Fe-2S iron-sulfur cluster-binding protein [Streptomyces sp. NPDC007984]|uniref:2Fe-2S iron-sulfur cluster-binding protein n=1 Tax=Streptomyces sp. NPDC007984 TaxID=3364801 RepID=UPI0036E58501